MTTILIEDDVDLQKYLSKHLMEIIPDLNIVAVAGTVAEAIQRIKTIKPELVFLDLTLHGQSGFEILQHFSKRTFEVVVMTGHRHFAGDAAKYGVGGYLTKGCDDAELIDTLNRVRHNVDIRRMAKEYQQFQPKARKPLYKTRNPDGSARYIYADEICFVEAKKAWSAIHCSDHTRYTSDKQLCEWERQHCSCADTRLVRVHRSYIINVRHVQEWRHSGKEAIVTLYNGKTIPVSRTYKRHFLAALQAYNPDI